MATTSYGGYDQLSVAFAETFREYVDDNVFESNQLFKDGWDNAEKVEPGRFLSLPLLTSKNQTAQSFGAYDEVNSSPQSLFSAAAFGWSFYTAAVMLDYQTLSLNRGPNVRINVISSQLETAVASLSDVMGQDLCQFPGGAPSLGAKAASTPNGLPAFGIVEATDDGTVVNTYGNINRTGAGSFANWQGNRIATLTAAGIGTAANDAPPALFYTLYTQASHGSLAPDKIYTTRQGVAAYMYAQYAQQRLAPGDIANYGFSGAKLFNADITADDHFVNPTNAGKVGCNFFEINTKHTRFFYYGEKGFDFVPWIDAQSVIAKLARYVGSLQFASSQPRSGGQLLNVNTTLNL